MKAYARCSKKLTETKLTLSNINIKSVWFFKLYNQLSFSLSIKKFLHQWKEPRSSIFGGWRENAAMKYSFSDIAYLICLF